MDGSGNNDVSSNKDNNEPFFDLSNLETKKEEKVQASGDDRRFFGPVTIDTKKEEVDFFFDTRETTKEEKSESVGIEVGIEVGIGVHRTPKIRRGSSSLTRKPSRRSSGPDFRQACRRLVGGPDMGAAFGRASWPPSRPTKSMT